jgi:hypothetical protein
MTKYEFLARLERALRSLPSSQRDDVLRDYEEHFAQAALAGKSSEETAAALGDPEAIAAEIRNIEGSDREAGQSFGRTIGSTVADMLRDFPFEKLSRAARNLSAFDTEEIHREAKQPAAGVRTVTIEARTAAVELQMHDGSDAQIELNGRISAALADQVKLLAQVSAAGELHISVVIDGLRLTGFTASNLRLRVGLPQHVYERVRIDLTTGDVDIADLRTALLSCVTTTGDIHLRSCTAQELSLTTTTGDVTCEHGIGLVKAQATTGDILLTQHDGPLNVRVTTGDIIVKQEQLAHAMSFATTTGDTLVTIAQVPQSGSVELITTVGSTRIVLPTETLAGKWHKALSWQAGGSSEPKITGRATTGDVQIRLG